MRTVCPTCEPFDHGGEPITWRVCSLHARRLHARRLDANPAAERCPWCGTEVAPGQLIGNALANGAMPKVEAAIRSTKLYTDELGELRKRVAELEAAPDWAMVRGLNKRIAELEALNEAGARAVEALEGIGEQARQRIAELESSLLQSLDLYARAECVGPTRQERAKVDEMRVALGLCLLDDFVSSEPFE